MPEGVHTKNSVPVEAVEFGKPRRASCWSHSYIVRILDLLNAYPLPNSGKSPNPPGQKICGRGDAAPRPDLNERCSFLTCGDRHWNAHQIAVKGPIVEARVIEVRISPRSFEVYCGIGMVYERGESCADSPGWKTLWRPWDVRLAN